MGKLCRRAFVRNAPHIPLSFQVMKKPNIHLSCTFEYTTYMYTDNVSSGSNQENGVYHFGNMQANQETYGNTACATKTFLNLFGNIFVSATIFPKVSKHGNIGTKHTVSQQCSLSRASSYF